VSQLNITKLVVQLGTMSHDDRLVIPMDQYQRHIGWQQKILTVIPIL